MTSWLGDRLWAQRALHLAVPYLPAYPLAEQTDSWAGSGTLMTEVLTVPRSTSKEEWAREAHANPAGPDRRVIK